DAVDEYDGHAPVIVVRRCRNNGRRAAELARHFDGRNFALREAHVEPHGERERVDDGGATKALPSKGVAMEQVVRWLNLWLGFLFEGLRNVVGTIVSIFDWPAALLGVPPELF